MFENDRPSIFTLILGTSKNQKGTMLENKGFAKAQQCTFCQQFMNMFALSR
jgi:hypothetical protein